VFIAKNRILAAEELETPAPHAAYLKLIDNARKVVAIAMAVCGIGLVVCVNRDDFLRLTLRRESEVWAWGCWVFGAGILVCLVGTFALIVEYLARPAKPTPFALRLAFVRALLTSVVVVAIGLFMTFASLSRVVN
jgi:hypothetical protein